MKTKIFIMLLLLFSNKSIAEDRIELETTIIKSNKELPKILFVVPWQDLKRANQSEQQFVLHSLFGDLFEPLEPGKDLAIGK